MTGRNAWTAGRIGIVIGAFFGASLVVGSILRAAGIDRESESASQALREELADGGYNHAEADCVEDRLVDEFGSVEEAVDAGEDDARVLIRPMMSCKEGSGITDPVADCFADALADRHEIENLGSEDIIEIANGSEPEDRKALAAASLVCQGTPPDVAECVIAEMAVKYPGMFDAELLKELTLAQQQFMFEAAARCDDG